MFFQCINIRQVPWEVLKTAAFGLGFQHLPRDLANVNACKNNVWSLYLKVEHQSTMGYAGMSGVLRYISAHEHCYFRLLDVSCFKKDPSFQLLFVYTAAGVNCCVEAVIDLKLA